MTPHGLRHWFASAAAEMNFSELTITGLLGHRIASISAPDSAFPLLLIASLSASRTPWVARRLGLRL